MAHDQNLVLVLEQWKPVPADAKGSSELPTQKRRGGPLAALGAALTGLRKKRKIPHDPLSYLPCKPKVGVKFRAYCSTMEQWGTTGVVLATIGDDTFLTEKKGEQQLVRLEGKPSDDYADLAEKDSFPATGKHVFDTIRKQRTEGLAEDRKKSLPEPTAAEDTRTAAVAATSGSAAHTDRTAQPPKKGIPKGIKTIVDGKVVDARGRVIKPCPPSGTPTGSSDPAIK